MLEFWLSHAGIDTVAPSPMQRKNSKEVYV